MIDFLRGSFGKVIAFVVLFIAVLFTVKQMANKKQKVGQGQEKQVAEKITIKRDYTDYKGFKNKYLFRDPETGKQVTLQDILDDKDKNPNKKYLDEDGNEVSKGDIIKEAVKDGVIKKDPKTGDLVVDKEELKKFENVKDAVSGDEKAAKKQKEKEEKEKLLAELEGKNGTKDTDPNKLPDLGNEGDIDKLKRELKALEKQRASQEVKTDLIVRNNNKRPEKSEEYTISPLAAFQYVEPSPVQKLSDKYMPYGRMIKCVLRTAIDSSNQETPVVGLILEDVWHDGKKIIPAGAEVHGWAAKSPLRDRLSTQNNWVVVWRTRDGDNGKELKMKALALDYDYNPKTDTFGITDGSAGLKGEVIESDEYAQVKLYAMKFIQGVGEGYTSFITEKLRSQQSGDVINSTVNTETISEQDEYKAIFGEAASQVAEMYIQNIIKEIEENGSYVRVHAGKTFYLYTTETVDRKDAKPGASSGKDNLEETKRGREKYVNDPEADLLLKSIQQLQQSRGKK